mmetsp:Transcript_42278/g.90218  ORF Transcript_42278/g.90218 Transcript_42278/m.90218 type:complete len:222 (+) Transcript_42278:387-1052(+)
MCLPSPPSPLPCSSAVACTARPQHMQTAAAGERTAWRWRRRPSCRGGSRACSHSRCYSTARSGSWRSTTSASRCCAPASLTGRRSSCARLRGSRCRRPRAASSCSRRAASPAPSLPAASRTASSTAGEGPLLLSAPPSSRPPCSACSTPRDRCCCRHATPGSASVPSRCTCCSASSHARSSRRTSRPRRAASSSASRRSAAPSPATHWADCSSRRAGTASS